MVIHADVGRSGTGRLAVAWLGISSYLAGLGSGAGVVFSTFCCCCVLEQLGISVDGGRRLAEFWIWIWIS